MLHGHCNAHKQGRNRITRRCISTDDLHSCIMEQNTSRWPALNPTYPVFVNMSPRSKTVHKELTSASQEKRTKEIVLKNTESTCFTAGQQIIGKHKGVHVLLSFPPCPEQSTKHTKLRKLMAHFLPPAATESSFLSQDATFPNNTQPSIQERHRRRRRNFEGVAHKKLLELEPVLCMRKLRIVFAKTATA